MLLCLLALICTLFCWALEFCYYIWIIISFTSWKFVLTTLTNHNRMAELSFILYICNGLGFDKCKMRYCSVYSSQGVDYMGCLHISQTQTP